MESNVVMILAGAALVIFIAFARYRAGLARGRFLGMQAASAELSRGVSANYEREGEPLPEGVSKILDEIKVALVRAKTWDEKYDAYRVRLWTFGNEMGEASAGRGFDQGQDWMQPRKGELRVDLTVQELLDLNFAAHVGFERRMEPGDYLAFREKKEAQRVTDAIERFERNVPKEYRDPDEPYALSFNRQTLIWNRWPQKDDSSAR
jgi:hypothetical protein